MRVYLVFDSASSLVAILSADPQQIRALPRTGDELEQPIDVMPLSPRPLRGQTVHEIELPQELEGLSGADLRGELMRYQVKAGESRLIPLK
jgi:hypothetical protein